MPIGLEVYAALATVAAITTAVQASAAVVTLDRADRLSEELPRTTVGDLRRVDLELEAKRALKTGLLLTVASSSMNLAVLVSWGSVTLQAPETPWNLVLPLGAVTLISIVLVVAGYDGLRRLRKLARDCRTERRS